MVGGMAPTTTESIEKIEQLSGIKKARRGKTP
jgi:hypothetical protein